MRSKRKRVIERKADRDLTKRLAKARREAADTRIHHGLCQCSDEEKRYLSEGEAAADKSPRLICHDCSLPKLRVQIITNRPLDERERHLLQGLLR